MLIVKKFGGTSVADKERIFNVARRIEADYKEGHEVIVVLSAMGKQTDILIQMAKDINPNPPKRELDMLLTTGEQVSVALMAMALDSMGVPAVSLNAYQVAMHTTSVHGNARLKRIDTDRIRNELQNRRVVLLRFQGVNKYDDYTTLGREDPIQRQWPWPQPFMQTSVKYSPMSMEYIRPIRGLYRRQES